MGITPEEIRCGLEGFGFGRGSRLMVHSSLKSFGWVEGGAEAVIQALMDLVGAEGTILMPSFNHRSPFDEEGKGIYDPLKTSTSNGRIPDTFWRMSGVYRSLNPTHPYAAWGADAERYTKDHHLTLTMGLDSPLGLLACDGGSQLNFGTTHATTTAKHLAETMRQAPCLGYRIEGYTVRLPDGSLVEHRTWSWRERNCPLTESGEYIETEMEHCDLQKKGYIGECLVTYFQIMDLLDAVFHLLDNGKDEYPPCSGCPIRPRKTAVIRSSERHDSHIDLPSTMNSARISPAFHR